MYEDRDEYLEDLVDDDAEPTSAMVQALAVTMADDEDYEGLFGERYDGALGDLADVARWSADLSEE